MKMANWSGKKYRYLVMSKSFLVNAFDLPLRIVPPRMRGGLPS